MSQAPEKTEVGSDGSTVGVGDEALGVGVVLGVVLMLVLLLGAGDGRCLEGEVAEEEAAEAPARLLKEMRGMGKTEVEPRLRVIVAAEVQWRRRRQRFVWRTGVDVGEEEGKGKGKRQEEEEERGRGKGMETPRGG